jgi:hypothetical protein
MSKDKKQINDDNQNVKSTRKSSSNRVANSNLTRLLFHLINFIYFFNFKARFGHNKANEESKRNEELSFEIISSSEQNLMRLFF